CSSAVMSRLALRLFFVSCCGAHRGLHSFPTRRSSDLTFADQVSGVARDVGVEGRLGGQADVPGAAGLWRDLTNNVNELAGNLTRDRKSTRLNSSHVKISYAVFCLKKKKNRKTAKQTLD